MGLTPTLLAVAALVLLVATGGPLLRPEQSEPEPTWLDLALACAPALADLPGWQPEEPASVAAARVHQDIAAARAELLAAAHTELLAARVHAGLHRREPATPAAALLATWWLPQAPVSPAGCIGQPAPASILIGQSA